MKLFETLCRCQLTVTTHGCGQDPAVNADDAGPLKAGRGLRRMSGARIIVMIAVEAVTTPLDGTSVI